jgi:hypothetical protein
LISYASHVFNNVEKNYIAIEKEALALVYALHKFMHYLLGNRFIFYIDHMTFLCLIKKPQVFGRITGWLLLFLEHDFSVMYKLGHSHFGVDVLS